MFTKHHIKIFTMALAVVFLLNGCEKIKIEPSPGSTARNQKESKTSEKPEENENDDSPTQEPADEQPEDQEDDQEESKLGKNDEYKSFALPKVNCNTVTALTKLEQHVVRNPLPTHDGVSPWPGLWGFWYHQKAELYTAIYGTRIESTKKDVSMTRVRVVLKNLCNNETLASGSVELNTEKTMESFEISLTNHNLSKVESPKVIVSQYPQEQSLSTPSPEKQYKGNLIGLTLSYKVNDSEVTEQIPLTNLLNP